MIGATAVLASLSVWSASNRLSPVVGPTRRWRAADGLDAELVATLHKLKDRRNETFLVAAVVAARLGHERLWSVDDHSADTPDSADFAEREAAGKAISNA
jgi:hypothetical protein